MPVTRLRLAALGDLAKLLAPSVRSLPGVLTQAATKPPEDFRGLVDGLIAARACSEIDWKTDAETVAWAIGKLRGVPRGAFAWMKKIPDIDDHSTWELLEMAGQHLRTRRLQLAQLEISSDSHCLVVVPIADAKRLVSLGRAARFDDVDLFGDDLAAATKDRVRREKRDAAEEKRQAEREARRPKPKLEYFAKGKTFWWLHAAGRDLQTAYEAPGVRYAVTHHHPSAAAIPAARRAQIAAWKAEGFRALTAAQADALPKSREGYVALRPFPAKARYLVESGWIVRAFLVLGNTWWEGGGAAGRTFGSIQDVHHHATAAEAEAACAAEMARWSGRSKERTRAEIVALYEKKKSKR